MMSTHRRLLAQITFPILCPEDTDQLTDVLTNVNVNITIIPSCFKAMIIIPVPKESTVSGHNVHTHKVLQEAHHKAYQDPSGLWAS